MFMYHFCVSRNAQCLHNSAEYSQDFNGIALFYSVFIRTGTGSLSTHINRKISKICIITLMTLSPLICLICAIFYKKLYDKQPVEQKAMELEPFYSFLSHIHMFIFGKNLDLFVSNHNSIDRNNVFSLFLSFVQPILLRLESGIVN